MLPHAPSGVPRRIVSGRVACHCMSVRDRYGRFQLAETTLCLGVRIMTQMLGYARSYALCISHQPAAIPALLLPCAAACPALPGLPCRAPCNCAMQVLFHSLLFQFSVQALCPAVMSTLLHVAGRIDRQHKSCVRHHSRH